MPRRLRIGLVAVVLMTAGVVVRAGRPVAGGTERQRADEYRVKAAFLFNFTKFVEWPVSAFATPSVPFNVCVLGVDPFGEMLDETFRGRLIAGRAVLVRRMRDPESGCHLIFISSSEHRRLAVLADRLRATSVLTVSDEEGFNAVGGMIELFTDGESVQFNISPAAVERAGLRASARLIALAANQRHAGGRR
ncbi:MAG: YfiR family protein [Vicinamibacterales bacterium]